jgi:tetratricopeptide (TPR) repeat protein/predicted Ser/Thr protein kinase
MVGRTVGPYHIVAKLGEGGMGSVWKAKDTGHHNVVALKFLPRELIESDEPRRRFQREARATRTLDHPGIAKHFGEGEADGEMFIAVEYIDGETVADIIARGALPVRDAIQIAAETADALAHAHARGVIHRDITASNIMVTPKGRSVVIDFGLARLTGTSSITPTGAAIGTVAYQAPEVHVGQRAGPPCDIYGLGVVLYEMLTGTRPFTGDQPAAIIYSATQTRPRPPSTLRSGLPEALDAIVLKAMARNPKARYASARTFAARLRAYLGDSTSVVAVSPLREDGAGGGARARLPLQKRLAVLPFAESTSAAQGGGDGVVLARGLAATVSAALGGVHDLEVIPPTVSADEPPTRDARETARRLSANLALTGLLRASGDSLRVSYSLIDVQDGTQIAGDTIEGTTDDWFALEDQLVESVLRSLELRRGSRAPARLIHVAAHEEYLKALGLLQRSDNEASVDGAIALLERLLELEGVSGLVEAALAKAYHEKFMLTLHPEWVRRAEAACQEALRLDPHVPEVLVTLGRVLLGTGRFEPAVKSLEQALELRHDDVEALRFLSIAHERLGDVQSAERVARQAIALRPDYWNVHHRLGTLLFEAGRHQAAIESWERVIELTPDNAPGHSNLGAALFKVGSLEAAATVYRRSVEIHPTPNACTGLGTVLFYMSQREEAATWFQRAVDLNPRDAFAWGNLGDAQRWIPGQEGSSRCSLERAITLMEGQLEVNPRRAQAWGVLAAWLSKVGKLEEAAEAISRALDLAPDNEACVVYAVTVYLLIGDRRRATVMLHRAKAMGWSKTELDHDPELEALREGVGGGAPS